MIAFNLDVMRQRSANETAFKKALEFAESISENEAHFTDCGFAKAGKAMRETLPSASEMLVSFAKTTAMWATEGFPVVDEDAYKRRYATCSACEYWQAHPTDRCAACGCKGFKLWLATAKCKKGKWID